MAQASTFKRGDRVVFRTFKRSAHPGPRAQSIEPEPLGEDYQYEVEKFWIVSDVLDNNQIELRTRQGKTHIVHGDNPNLRHATWWDKLRFGSRFPKLDDAEERVPLRGDR